MADTAEKLKPSPPVTTHRLSDLFAALLDAISPLAAGEIAELKLVYRTVGGLKGTIPVPVDRVEAGSDEPDLTPMESAVLEVVGRMQLGDTFSTDEIASKAGYKNSGRLRDYLKVIAPAARLKSTNRGWVKT